MGGSWGQVWENGLNGLFCNGNNGTDDERINYKRGFDIQ